jgi:hypothetical protein
MNDDKIETLVVSLLQAVDSRLDAFRDEYAVLIDRQDQGSAKMAEMELRLQHALLQIDEMSAIIDAATATSSAAPAAAAGPPAAATPPPPPAPPSTAAPSWPAVTTELPPVLSYGPVLGEFSELLKIKLNNG